MNNKIKKTQTILFAGLIAALILPFSGMTGAYAELSDKQKERLISNLEKLEKQIEITTNEPLKERLKDEQQAILKKLLEDVDTEKLSQVEVVEKTKPTSKARVAASTLFNIYGVNSGCDNGKEIFNLKGDYVSGTTQLTITQSFQTQLTSGDSPNCEEHVWGDNVYINIVNIWDSSGCVGNMDGDPVETYSLNCATLGGIYVVKVTADHDGRQTGSYSYFWA